MKDRVNEEWLFFHRLQNSTAVLGLISETTSLNHRKLELDGSGGSHDRYEVFQKREDLLPAYLFPVKGISHKPGFHSSLPEPYRL